MDEYFLHFLWKFQKFETKPLHLSNGSTLQVFYPGINNLNAGPDFLEGKIRIDNIEWSGSIEIHHRSSDWLRHRHHKDKAYDNVILHVVWQHDQEINLSDGTVLATFQMADYVNNSLELNYRKYINQPVTIKCASFLPKTSSLVLTNMIDQALVERLSQKAEAVLSLLKENKDDWEQTTFQLLAKNFGFSVNSHPFETWASTLSYSLLKKYANTLDSSLAISFGQAGYLQEEPVDEYQERMTTLFHHLQRKHHLESHLQRHHWKFSRLRPANFPTIRMVELMALLLKYESLFSLLIHTENAKSLTKALSIDLPEYWNQHYDFGKQYEGKVNNLGMDSIRIIIINTVVPLLAAYSRYIDEQLYMDRAITLLEQIKPEKNRIINEWKFYQITPKNAHDSQALLQRYKQYCQKRRCLHCNVGISILQAGKP